MYSQFVSFDGSSVPEGALKIVFNDTDEFNDFLDMTRFSQETSAAFCHIQKLKNGFGKESDLDTFMQKLKSRYREIRNTDGSITCSTLVRLNEMPELFGAFFDLLSVAYISKGQAISLLYEDGGMVGDEC